MGEVRPPVALLRSVVRERVGAKIIQQWRRPPGKFQGVKAPSDVVENLADDMCLGDEPYDAHSLAARAQERVHLVDATNQARPRFPAGRKPGTIGFRRIVRLVLRRNLDESLASVSDSAMSIRVCPVVMDELGSPVGDVGSEACDPLQVVVVPVDGRHPLFPVIGDGSLGKVPHFRFLGRIGAEAAGCSGSPNHVEPHAQRILMSGISSPA